MLAVGLAASVLAAFQWHGYIRDQQSRQVATTTETARASMTSALQRDEDLVETLRGVVASGATVTNTQLQNLYTNVGATKTAGVIGLAYIEAVPFADLATFEATRQADPPQDLPKSAPSAPGSVPARSLYCLIRLSTGSSSALSVLSRSGRTQLEQELGSTFDYCSGATSSTLKDSAASGKETVTVLPETTKPDAHVTVSTHIFDVVYPIYASGAPLQTAAEREQALVGWADGLFYPRPVLGPIVSGASGLSITMSYHDPSGTVLVASAGPRLRGAVHRSVVLSADGRWTAVISVVPASVSATVQGIGVLADLLAIVLLMVLIVVLFRSRKRAFESIEAKNQELEHRALHDTLTGLPNRELILDIAAGSLERAVDDEHPLAVLLVDLDGFNAINDLYGHRLGDQVLEAVSGRLIASLGPLDTLGRLAGDEFVILAEGASIAGGADQLASRLLDALAEPFEILAPNGTTVVRITACIGVAIGPGRAAEDLLRDADTALNEAKSTGRRRFTVFEPAMHTAAQSRLAMTGELRTAIDQEQFFLVYQPIFHLTDVRPIGVEALLRWRHPLRGVVPPLEFIPLLEETGMIAEVGREVLRMACQQAKYWEQRGLPIFVSVNASALQLESEQFSADVDWVLQDCGLDPSRLTIEITESALIRDAPGTVRRLAALKALGIRLAIDDFGTGYSSLSYLRQFPVDILKIDRSFVSSMTMSTGGMALVRTMLELARALNLETVAEGIEDESQLSALEMEHCRSGQGFLLAKPLGADQIELFFDNARPRRMAAVHFSSS